MWKQRKRLPSRRLWQLNVEFAAGAATIAMSAHISRGMHTAGQHAHSFVEMDIIKIIKINSYCPRSYGGRVQRRAVAKCPGDVDLA